MAVEKDVFGPFVLRVVVRAGRLEPVERCDDVCRQPVGRALQPVSAVSGADEVLRRIQLAADEIHAGCRGDRRAVHEDDDRHDRRLSDPDRGLLPREDAAADRAVPLAPLQVRDPDHLHRGCRPDARRQPLEPDRRRGADDRPLSAQHRPRMDRRAKARPGDVERKRFDQAPSRLRGDRHRSGCPQAPHAFVH